MKTRFTIVAVLGATASPVLAHTGHLGELAGHDHWVAGAAIGAAIAVAVWQGLKGKKSDESADAEKSDQEPQEA